MKEQIDVLVRTIRAAHSKPLAADFQLATLLTTIGVDGLSEARQLRAVLARWAEDTRLSAGDRAYALQQLKKVAVS